MMVGGFISLEEFTEKCENKTDPGTGRFTLLEQTRPVSEAMRARLCVCVCAQEREGMGVCECVDGGLI